MSVPFAEDWFSFSIRRNRKSYILASLLLIAIMIVVILAMRFFDAHGRSAYLVFGLFFIPYVICTYSLTAQRLRDMNLSGWLALLWIPVEIADSHLGGAASLAFLIVLCAIPGTRGPNRYGPDPLGRGEDMPL